MQLCGITRATKYIEILEDIRRRMSTRCVARDEHLGNRWITFGKCVKPGRVGSRYEANIVSLDDNQERLAHHGNVVARLGPTTILMHGVSP